MPQLRQEGLSECVSRWSACDVQVLPAHGDGCPAHRASREAYLQQRVTELEGLVVNTTPQSQSGTSSQYLPPSSATWLGTTPDAAAENAIGGRDSWIFEEISDIDSILRSGINGAGPSLTLDNGKGRSKSTISPCNATVCAFHRYCKAAWVAYSGRSDLRETRLVDEPNTSPIPRYSTIPALRQ